MPIRDRLTTQRIFWFWLPLAAMWMMMAIEQPAIAGVISRLPDPQINLAAFGITFALALFVEGPVVMLLTAGTALPKDRQSYQRLLNFTHMMVVGLTALHVLIGITPLYDLIVRNVIGAPEEVIEISRHGFLLMTPWTGAIAYRRLWQGVLIRFDRTRIVPLTIAARLVTTVAVLMTGLTIGTYSGIYVGTIALSFGVTVAAIVSYAFARSTVKEWLSEDTEEEVMSWQELLSFYLPLALTSLIVLANQPIFSMSLSRAPEALASLAVWPVIMSLLFLGRSISLSFQEAAVALLDDSGAYQKLRNFAWILAGSLLLIFGLISATPLARFWYAGVAGLTQNLTQFAILPTAIVALVPAVSTLISWQRGVLVHVKQTQYITHSVVLSVAVLIAVLWGLVSVTDLSGAMIGALAMTLSVMAEWGYLLWRSRNAARDAGLLLPTSLPTNFDGSESVKPVSGD